MKKTLHIIASGVLALALACPAFASTPANTLAAQADASDVNIYRLFSTETGEHLYTPDQYEAYFQTTFGAWKYEGIGWYAPTTGTAVYRLYNAELDNHLYTSDLGEAAALTKDHGWTFDNDAKPLFYSGGNTDIYRMYNENLAGMHLLTTDANEYETLPEMTEGDWEQEGAKLSAVRLGVDASKYMLGLEDQSLLNQEKGRIIENTDCLAAIEATVKMSGEGEGYHAKIVAVTPTSGVSFGLQFDKYASKPYGSSTAFVIENIAHNNEGGQRYTRGGYADPRKSYRLLLTVGLNGVCKAYVDGELRGQVKNNLLASQLIAGQNLYLRVEGSGRVNGDSIYATFSDIKLKTHDKYDANKVWLTNVDHGVSFDTNKGIKSDASEFASNKRITIGGTVRGLKYNEDWDSAYEGVSGIIQFVE